MYQLNILKLSKGLLFILLSVLILTIGFGYQHGEVEATEVSAIDMIKINEPAKINDSAINLLGKSFDEIKQVLGTAEVEGYSELFGPHYYILFQNKEGLLRFCSPEPMENKVAVSVILGPGQEVLGAEVGMLFSEIENILGPPDFGPELGMDDLFYMDYFIGENLISFSAEDINGSTKDAFLKWEGFEFSDTNN